MHSWQFARAAAVCSLVCAFSSPLLAQGLPPVPTPAGNPTTPNKVLLGKALFFEEQISSTGAVACATCHPFEAGSADPRTAPHPGADGTIGTADDTVGSPGVVLQAAGGGYVPSGPFPFDRQVTPRQAMSVINAAFSTEMFWDGRAGPAFADPVSGSVVLPMNAGLEAQVAVTTLSDVEMAHMGETWPNVVARLQASRPLALATNLTPDLVGFVGDGSAGYPPLFQAAFGTPAITPARVCMALAAYMRTLVSDQAPIDAFLNGTPGALTAQEQSGFNLFSTIGNCTICHTPPLFSFPNRFFNTGVRPPAEDLGRGAISGISIDNGAFKPPSLRNVELRGPFFHNGGMSTLSDVVDFYDRGGDFPAVFLFPLNLTQQQKNDLVAFLGRPLTDPRVVNGLPPFDRPTLWSENSSRRASVVAPGSPPGAGLPAPRFVFEEPGYGENPTWTIALADAPVGVPGALLVGLATAGPLQFGNLAVHVDLTNLLVLGIPPTVNGGSGINGPVGGVSSFSLPIPDVQGFEFPVIMQALFPDPANSIFVASPAVSVPLFPQRGT